MWRLDQCNNDNDKRCYDSSTRRSCYRERAFRLQNKLAQDCQRHIPEWNPKFCVEMVRIPTKARIGVITTAETQRFFEAEQLKDSWDPQTRQLYQVVSNLAEVCVVQVFAIQFNCQSGLEKIGKRI
ncbi:hypothetical protein SEMRO_384_G131540.1 [Seminavis robusta]|uniref:Uncharacterized protein n=1 Tax=Seminavis robusta TaxID=568900 RepID=A0A9N8DZ68_9STRA|nr:hypothetical protein SEMRO_384_G131540.1 [Seminavis robusta]|eukprot:Sro384_g131540.1 n/a (126) ;mRNA; f:59548-60019